MIAAVSPDGVIGLDGGIPWHYSADQMRFKRLTLGATVIMGRSTWDSLGGRPLPGRRNLVVTSRPITSAHVDTFPSVEAALAACADQDAWFIGGAGIYAAAMAHADRIDLTYVPDRVTDPGAVHFPPIDPAEWEAGPRIRFDDDPRLERQLFLRRRPR
jgi:dihydrofolate reductase